MSLLPVDCQYARGWQTVAEIIDDRPRVENFGIAEFISVIPFADFVVLIFCLIIACDFFDLINRKAEVFTVFRVQNRIDCKVVQSAENAFFLLRGECL